MIDDSRSLRAFAAAIRNSPAFWLRVASLLFFTLALAETEGVKTAVEALLLGAIVVMAIGYPLFRKRGRVP